MTVRDRIIELRRVRADTLKPNPRNWRTHPPSQQAALQGVLNSVGYAGALLARTLPDGSLELIDGHLRAQTTPEDEVPVLVLDVDAREADLLLAVHDPLSEMAGTDGELLSQLLDSFEETDAGVRRLLDKLSASAGGVQLAPLKPPNDAVIAPSQQVVVHCADEEDQRAVYEEMKARGYRCRLLSL